MTTMMTEIRIMVTLALLLAVVFALAYIWKD